ncbi:DUF6155 family protein [Mucilaginibacter sp. McL0603]|uniref:DUF6155 family protein n=1 Tax=Mucilaginibacter sp. McL0603 TaxID=3415670 RepID=UPI003CED3298
MSIKSKLARFEKKALIEIISDLYKKNKSVQEYLDFYINPDEGGLLEKYRVKVYEAFYPKRGFDYSLSKGKQSISDFKKLDPSTELLIDLMLFYVETGIKFTNEFGDMNETFYNSIESTFAKALKITYDEGLPGLFEQRCLQILEDTQHIGWGLNDGLSEIFYKFY